MATTLKPAKNKVVVQPGQKYVGTTIKDIVGSSYKYRSGSTGGSSSTIKQLPATSTKPQTTVQAPAAAPSAVAASSSAPSIGFSSSFFSLEGVKERLLNVKNVYASIFSGQGVKANTPSKTLNFALETAAEHPFITAGLATGGIMAAKALPGVIARGSVAVPVVAKTSANAFNWGSKSLLIGGGAGLAAGALLFGQGKATTAPQDLGQEITQKPEIKPYQDTQAYQDTEASQGTTYTIQDSPGASIQGSPSQGVNPQLLQLPTQYTPTQLSPMQTASQEQTAESGGFNWGMAAVLAAAIILLKK